MMHSILIHLVHLLDILNKIHFADRIDVLSMIFLFLMPDMRMHCEEKGNYMKQKEICECFIKQITFGFAGRFVFLIAISTFVLNATDGLLNFDFLD